MTPRIEQITEKKLVGKWLTMSFADYKVAELWKSFMPARKEIKHPQSGDLISMTIYPPTHFTDFHPTNPFEKWAAVEVSSFEEIPADMDAFTLPDGLYAVFEYRGISSDHSIFRYIFESWLPDSGYYLDNRPHFEVLGSKYKNNDPTSEEEIWIPVKPQ